MGGLNGLSLGGLNPAQARVVTELMSLGADRPRFPPSLGADLRSDMEDALAPIVRDLVEPLWVTKRGLGQVHACEGHYRAELQEPFGWNRRNAEGTVVHKALELSVSARSEIAPLDLVDRALDTLMADEHRTSPRPWLLEAAELDVAELRARVNDTVVKFRECWPPLAAAWAPRTETGIGADLCGDRVVLRGRVDLVLGVARGDEARSLVVDLKTGRGHPAHADDLRFYALVQTLRVGVPPFRVASYYLDTATFHAEDVTLETLETALRRTVDGAAKMARLLDPSAAAGLSAGPTCGWCGLRPGCPAAAAAADAAAADDLLTG